jgi:hypothetical protein
MTLEELEKLCVDAETDGLLLSNPGVRVCIPGKRYGKTVRIAPGLIGENLGHYPDGTHVFLRTEKVRAFLEKTRKSLGSD